MSLIRCIRHNEFSPADIGAMDIALQNACAAAGGRHASEALRENLALKIVSYALAGERDPTALYLTCLKDAGLV